MTVFNKGTWKAGIGSNPNLGKKGILNETGERRVWKNAQNTLKKNHTSLKRNQINPHFSPLCTREVCCPWRALSRFMSRNHSLKIINVMNSVKRVVFIENSSLNQSTTLLIVKNDAILILRGSHLLSTTWDNCHAVFSSFSKRKYALTLNGL